MNCAKNCINNCSECPFFEFFLREFEVGVGLVDKGRCHKHNLDEIWGTKTPCSYVEENSLEILEKEAFGKKAM